MRSTSATASALKEVPTLGPMVELTLEMLDISEENFDNNGGWGLSLVAALTAEWRAERTFPRGKWVWARFKA